MHRWLDSFFMENRDSCIQQKIPNYWWPGNTKRQGISNNSIELFKPKHSSFIPRRVKTYYLSQPCNISIMDAHKATSAYFEWQERWFLANIGLIQNYSNYNVFLPRIPPATISKFDLEKPRSKSLIRSLCLMRYSNLYYTQHTFSLGAISILKMKPLQSILWKSWNGA